jgi:hypothetical protein
VKPCFFDLVAPVEKNLFASSAQNYGSPIEGKLSGIARYDLFSFDPGRHIWLL